MKFSLILIDFIKKIEKICNIENNVRKAFYESEQKIMVRLKNEKINERPKMETEKFEKKLTFERVPSTIQKDFDEAV